MKKDSANSEVFIRPATVADSPIILHHRRAMFEDMGDGTPAERDAMEASSGPWLSKALADGSYRGWLAEAAGRVIAGGGVLIYPFPSRPADMRTQRAIVLNVYTEPEYRHRGIRGADASPDPDRRPGRAGRASGRVRGGSRRDRGGATGRR